MACHDFSIIRTYTVGILLSLSIAWFAPCAASQAPQGEEVQGATDVESATPATSPILDGLDRTTESVVTSASEVLDSVWQLGQAVVGDESTALGWSWNQVFSLLSVEFMGRPGWLYLLSLVIILLGLFLRHFVVRRILALAHRLAERTKTRYDNDVIDALGAPLRLGVFLLGLYIGIRILMPGEARVPAETFSDIVMFYYPKVMVLLFLGTFTWGLLRMADVVVGAVIHVAGRRARTQVDTTFLPLAKRTVKVFIVAVVAIAGLDELGLDGVVKGLIAAAGVSGLAIGLAAQDTIKNFFGSIVLLIDRPFSVGDWVLAGDSEGTVETVGVRSTKIRTFSQTLVTVPNSAIVDRDINNFSRMPIRRVSMTIGLTYDTPPDKMQELLTRIREMLATDPEVWQKLILVRFTDFGDSSLDILLYYFTNTTAWDEHLAIRERVNLQIMQLVDELELAFAFPTRTVHLKQDAVE